MVIVRYSSLRHCHQLALKVNILMLQLTAKIARSPRRLFIFNNFTSRELRRDEVKLLKINNRLQDRYIRKLLIVTLKY